ncbi:uncharacterized protein LOC121808844 [Salvia splendens]|uniref:uncharacterized protein LOC121808844 n=1 Tax=Salvia splendens TaxID=180675 RepID=UPI001C257C40|nr:uncharacterized protein LOC121808844 [Salvia splendens]
MDRPNTGGNRVQGGQAGWSSAPQGNWSSGGQSNWSSRQKEGDWRGYQHQILQYSNQGRQSSNQVVSYVPQYFQGNQQNHQFQSQPEQYGSSGFYQQGHGGGRFNQRNNRQQNEYPGDMTIPHQPNDAVREIQKTQREHRAALQMLTKQLSQVAISLGELRGNEGKIPATVQPLAGRENVNTVSLKSEGVYQSSTTSFPTPRISHNANSKSASDQVTAEEESYIRKQVAEKRRRIEAEEVTNMVRPGDLPPKRTDPGVFTLSISVRNVQIEHAMCDLGASINIMPYSIFKKLGNAKLVETNIEIQLADGSCIYPEGVLEDEVVKVNRFMYPADFFVIKMTEPGVEESIGILLGRPFLSTANTVIDVRQGIINLEFKGERFTVEINKAAKRL